MTKTQALKKVAQYIIDDKEREDYEDFCDVHNLDPKDIKGKLQSAHVYACALIGLGLEY